MKTPEFHDGDTVMICKHLYEQACRGEKIKWDGLNYMGRFDPPRKFTREDSSEGHAEFFVSCRPCASGDPHEVDYIEEIVMCGKLHVADRLAHVLHRGAIR